MAWIWDGGFRAHQQEMDGTRTEKVFTSVAQARQFVEQEEQIVLATRHKPPRKRSRNRIRKAGKYRPDPNVPFKFGPVTDLPIRSKV